MPRTQPKTCLEPACPLPQDTNTLPAPIQAPPLLGTEVPSGGRRSLVGASPNPSNGSSRPPTHTHRAGHSWDVTTSSPRKTAEMSSESMTPALPGAAPRARLCPPNQALLPSTLLPCVRAQALVCAFTAGTPQAAGLKDFPLITTKSLPWAVSCRPGPFPRCRAFCRCSAHSLLCICSYQTGFPPF